MSPIKVLKMNENLMIRLRIYTPELSDPTNDFFKSISACCISFNVFAFIVASAIFVHQNISNVMVAMRTGTVIVGTSQALGLFLCVGCKIDKVKMLHIKLQAIVDQATKDDHNANITDLYWQTEQTCRKLTQLFSYYIFFNLSSFVMALNGAIYYMCVGNWDTSTWDLPLNIVFPIDTQPIWGWLLKWFFEFATAFSYACCMVMPTSYFVCFCIYIMAISNHFELLVDTIHLDVERIQSDATWRKKDSTVWHSVQMKLFQLIDHHVNAFDVFNLVASVNSAAIFSLLPVNGLVLALSMYTMENSEFDLIVFVFDVVCVLCALMWCSFYCYFANVSSDRLSSIGNAAYASNWYNFPVECQRFIVLMILRSQKPVYFQGLKLINCTLEVFGKLCKSACSYYLIFRSFSQI